MTLQEPMMVMVEKYLAARRANGVQLRTADTQLRSFARYADQIGHRSPLTIEVAIGWARSSKRASQTGQAQRLEVLRPFARYLRTRDPRVEIPSPQLIGPPHPRRQPHIYTDDELHALLAATSRLHPVGGLRPLTLRTYLSLLACTGMRPPEPLRLSRDDVDLAEGTLTVRQTKFGKSRLVPLHDSATCALRAYGKARDRHQRRPRSPTFFLLDGGVALTLRKAHTAFQRLRRELGWAALPGRPAPRLYDLRHTFVCRRMLRWYAEGRDVHQAIAALVTYLGHVNVTHTYWYLTGIPELMAQAATRFERWGDQPEGGRR